MRINSNSGWGFLSLATAFGSLRWGMIWTTGHESWGPWLVGAAIVSLLVALLCFFWPYKNKSASITTRGADSPISNNQTGGIAIQGGHGHTINVSERPLSARWGFILFLVVAVLAIIGLFLISHSDGVIGVNSGINAPHSTFNAPSLTAAETKAVVLEALRDFKGKSSPIFHVTMGAEIGQLGPPPAPNQVTFFNAVATQPDAFIVTPILALAYFTITNVSDKPQTIQGYLIDQGKIGAVDSNPMCSISMVGRALFAIAKDYHKVQSYSTDNMLDVVLFNRGDKPLAPNEVISGWTAWDCSQFQICGAIGTFKIIVASGEVFTQKLESPPVNPNLLRSLFTRLPGEIDLGSRNIEVRRQYDLMRGGCTP